MRDAPGGGEGVPFARMWKLEKAWRTREGSKNRVNSHDAINGNSLKNKLIKFRINYFIWAK
jgi:hypothetical protein